VQVVGGGQVQLPECYFSCFLSVFAPRFCVLPSKSRQIEKFLDLLCKFSVHQEIYFIWRPFLKDPDDDLVAEVAFASGAKQIVTFNVKDFKGVESLGISASTPKQFLLRYR
jgi:hypothetical protein